MIASNIRIRRSGLSSLPDHTEKRRCEVLDAKNAGISEESLRDCGRAAA